MEKGDGIDVIAANKKAFDDGEYDHRKQRIGQDDFDLRKIEGPVIDRQRNDLAGEADKAVKKIQDHDDDEQQPEQLYGNFQNVFTTRFQIVNQSHRFNPIGSGS